MRAIIGNPKLDTRPQSFRAKFDPKPSGPEGFTLIEVIVTVVILTLGLLVILGVFLGAAKANSHARKMDIAHYLAQEAIEQFHNSQFIQIQPFEESYGDIENHPNYRRKVEVHQTGNLKVVRVTTLFDLDQHQAQIETFYADL
jgi:prepilin-type N-terminal cleavage/methylation domain-containing protein